MSEEKSPFVVSADWLESRLSEHHIRVVDASWYLPAQNRNGRAEYEAGHIPGAVFFDQDEIADKTTGLPHSVPTPEAFAEAVGALGLADDDTMVVYDGPGLFSAPRVWWLLRIMGARHVLLLDGGLDGWKREGRPLETGTTTLAPATFTPDYRAEAVTSFEAMRTIVSEGAVQIADARGPGRFFGTEAEPRPGMRSGHMPGALNLPAGSFASEGRLKPLGDLKALITEAGIDLDRPVVTSCGSGVTAAIITLALHSLGHTDNTLYDGSWSEWGSRSDTPVTTEPTQTKNG
ncbi:thiosulfate/3-mercaptopyruvate sulfurtransferase [Rhizobium sp. RU20A]|uniref:3-mercaptopyruvate sulfurtransferase n=1 Tax=Rhizobium sp. RU20A TaxID=1907412 RepID=UPI000953E680|nr:3-mercaptopyruvate sulfurtransferase [Rhizobium sp. RU20A]SIQ12278.1 thiosulfate/3-mercaptopyruvate sulfurtransferase [Rhizobium sp. RU20A]